MPESTFFADHRPDSLFLLLASRLALRSPRAGLVVPSHPLSPHISFDPLSCHVVSACCRNAVPYASRSLDAAFIYDGGLLVLGGRHASLFRSCFRWPTYSILHDAALPSHVGGAWSARSYMPSPCMTLSSVLRPSALQTCFCFALPHPSAVALHWYRHKTRPRFYPPCCTSYCAARSVNRYGTCTVS
jgi:hypothetical protein